MYRPFPHYAPVSKHKEMKTRLGWTISYKSLYFVHPSLELVPLFTGMRERSIRLCKEILVLSVFTWFISAWWETTIYLLLAILILIFLFAFFFVCGKRTLQSICSKQNESVTEPHLLCLRFGQSSSFQK